MPIFDTGKLTQSGGVGHTFNHSRDLEQELGLRIAEAMWLRDRTPYYILYGDEKSNIPAAVDRWNQPWKDKTNHSERLTELKKIIDDRENERIVEEKVEKERIDQIREDSRVVREQEWQDEDDERMEKEQELADKEAAAREEAENLPLSDWQKQINEQASLPLAGLRSEFHGTAPTASAPVRQMPPLWLLHGGTDYALSKGLDLNQREVDGEKVWAVTWNPPGVWQDAVTDLLGIRVIQTASCIPSDGGGCRSRWDEAELIASGRLRRASAEQGRWLAGDVDIPDQLSREIPSLKATLDKIANDLEEKVDHGDHHKKEKLISIKHTLYFYPPKPTIKPEHFWWLYGMLYEDDAYKRPGKDSIPLIFGEAKKQGRSILYETNITNALTHLEKITSEYFINHMPQSWLDWKAGQTNNDSYEAFIEWTGPGMMPAPAKAWVEQQHYIPPPTIEIGSSLNDRLTRWWQSGGSPQKPKKKSRKKSIKKQRKKSKKPLRKQKKQRKQRKKSSVKSYKKRPNKSTKLRR
jgi:hypothetical protein